MLVDTVASADGMVQVCIDAANKSGLVRDDDIVVVTGGVPVGRPGSTNFIKVHRIGQPLDPG
jgi:pyruvate kinase